MLSTEQKQKMIDNQITEYSAKIFQLEITKTALLATDDIKGVSNIDKRIEALRKAIEAVRGMKELI